LNIEYSEKLKKETNRVLKTRIGTGAAVGTTGLGAYVLTRKKDGDK
jgi:hypothetical protein